MCVCVCQMWPNVVTKIEIYDIWLIPTRNLFLNAAFIFFLNLKTGSFWLLGYRGFDLSCISCINYDVSGKSS